MEHSSSGSGIAPDARLVILNADELGLTRSSNVGVYDALRHGRGHQRLTHGARPLGPRRRRRVPG